MRVVWDQIGKRKFETGVDRAVLYLPEGVVVPWNGLTAVDENSTDGTVVSFHYDGVKYLDHRTPGDFSATLRALTYPDEFAEFDGYAVVNGGFLLGEQPVNRRFCLVYRTLVGNDQDGTEHGHKLHILYNLTAKPSTRSYAVLGNQVDPSDLAWDISGVPEVVPGYRPTAHAILDSTQVSKYLLREIEDILYGVGTDATPDEPGIDVMDGGSPESAGSGSFDGGSPLDSGSGLYDGGTPTSPGEGVFDGNVGVTIPPRLPSLEELTDMIENWALIDITDHGDGTWSAKLPDEFLTMIDSTTFEIREANALYLDENTYVLSDTLNEKES